MRLNFYWVIMVLFISGCSDKNPSPNKELSSVEKCKVYDHSLEKHLMSLDDPSEASRIQRKLQSQKINYLDCLQKSREAWRIRTDKKLKNSGTIVD